MAIAAPNVPMTSVTTTSTAPTITAIVLTSTGTFGESTMAIRTTPITIIVRMPATVRPARLGTTHASATFTRLHCRS